MYVYMYVCILHLLDSCKFLHDRSDYKSGWQLEREWQENQYGKEGLSPLPSPPPPPLPSPPPPLTSLCYSHNFRDHGI